MMSTIELRVGAWYGDHTIRLPVPSDWEIIAHVPHTPRALRSEELLGILRRPVGTAPLRELASGKQKPLILVDDLTRPTPVDQVIPEVLEQFRLAGIERHQVTVLMSGGTHRPATHEQMLRKLGASASGCQLKAHDSDRDCIKIGRSRYGTPVLVNRAVADSDLVIGIGGAYPQHSVGFGGGSKLILGALGRQSIVGLHYGHPSMAGKYDIENDFRRDLDDIASIAGLRLLITLHVNADREVVRAVAGDHRAFYKEAAAFSLEAYSVPLPGEADVVIANAYPMDVSLTFARAKGMAPLLQTAPNASRILVAACSEGLGYHGLFPYLNGPALQRQRDHLRRLSVNSPRRLLEKGARKLYHRVETMMTPRGKVGFPEGLAGETPAVPLKNQIHLFSPGCPPGELPATIPGVSHARAWEDAVANIEREQRPKTPLVVALYTCAPLQCLEFTGSERTAYLTGATK